MFKIEELERDKDKVFEQILVSPNVNMINRSDESIYLMAPRHFRQINLARYQETALIYGLFALITESGYYSVCNICAMVNTLPDRLTIMKHQDMVYDLLHFNPGSVIIKTFDLVQNELMLYDVVNMLPIQGKYPWYLNYSDLLKLFITAKHHAGSRIGDNLKMMEAILSFVALDPSDETQFYRQSEMKSIPRWSSLSRISSATLPTFSKVMGPYADDGMMASLITENNVVQDLETILRH